MIIRILVLLCLFASPAVAQIDKLQDIVESLKGQTVKGENREEKINIALQQSIDGINAVSHPDVYLYVPRAIVSELVAKKIRQGLGQIKVSSGIDFDLGSLEIMTGRQEIDATVSGTLRLSDSNTTLDIVTSIIIAPSVNGNTVELLPSIAELKIKDVHFGKLPIKLPNEAIVTTLNALMQQALTSINAVLPKIDIEIPSPEPLRVDLTATLANVPGIAVEPHEIVGAPLHVMAAAVLIAEDGISAVAEFDLPLSTGVQEPAAVATRDIPADRNTDARYMAFTESFKALVHGQLGETGLTPNATALIAKRTLARYVNLTWKDFTPAVTYNFDGLNIRSDSKTIRLANRPNYSCRSDRDCTIQKSHDDRNCRRCIWTQCPTFSKPFRQCEQCINEPVCESAKAAQNAIYEADYGTKKLDCERIKGQENLGCETGKVFVNALAEVGDIGRIQADLKASGSATLAKLGLSVGDGLNTARIDGILSASSDVRLGLDFVPLDIGHVLACPFPGKVFYSAHIDAPRQATNVTARINQAAKDGASVALEISVQPSDIDIGISPPPMRGIIEQNPQLTFTCSPVLSGNTVGLAILGEAKGVISEADLRNIFGGQAAAVISGNYRYKFQPIQFDVPIKIKELTIGGIAFDSRAELTEKAVRVSFSST